MAVLLIETVQNAGRQYDLQQDTTMLGRHVDCDIVIESRAVSLRHARIERIGGIHYVEDLGSRNGTMINGHMIRDRVQLSDGDRLRICDVVFRFRAAEVAGELFSVVDDIAPNADTELGERICVLEESFGDLENACEQVRRSVANHRLVFHPFTEKCVLQDALIQGDPRALRILGEGFYRTIVLDVARGLRPRGNFDLARFYEYAFRQLEEAFNLPPTNSYHEQDLMQILMDEELSLVCLLNAQEALSDDRKRLRSLTQEKHHALIIYRQPGGLEVGGGDDPRHSEVTADIHVATIVERDFDDEGSQLQRPKENAQSKLQALIELSRKMGQRMALDYVWPEVLESLFTMFPQADRAFIVLRDPAAGRLVPKAVKCRRGNPDAPIQISRMIVDAMSASTTAILSADAATDPRFDLAQGSGDFQVHSMMCVPLVGMDGALLGVLEIDTVNPYYCFTHDDLELLASVACQATLVVENGELHYRAVREEMLSHELKRAQYMWRSFFPSSPPKIDQYEFFDFCKPAAELGGDYYDYVPLSGGRLAVVVADVAGKGLPAALLAVRLSAETGYCLARAPYPSAAVARLNQVFCEKGWAGSFATAAMAVLDPARHEVTIVNAGHNSPLLRRSLGEIEALETVVFGMPLGVDSSAVYRQHTLTLAPGDSLTMYTDGVTEAMNATQQCYGFERLRDQLQAGEPTVHSLGRKILDDVQRFVGNQPQNDDMCLVSFRRKE
jgi:sigma-B regulation protein RsbU (phosphoserine phosphatase)